MAWKLFLATDLALANLVCLSLVLFGLPGTWLMLALSALVDHYTETPLFAHSTLYAAAGIAALGEVLEFVAGSQGLDGPAQGGVVRWAPWWAGWAAHSWARS